MSDDEVLHPLDSGNGETVGYKQDLGKIRWDLLPDEMLEEVAKVFTYGAEKYSDFNWRNGMRWSRLYAATWRHMVAWRKGETWDPESGCHHLAHVIWNVLILEEHQRLVIGIDDSPSALDLTPQYVAGIIDGEGTITISRGSKRKPYTYWTMLVSVASTDRLTLERLKERYGGTLTNRGMRVTPHPVQATRPAYGWQVSAVKAQACILDVLPYLKIKSQQAHIALEFQCGIDKRSRHVGEQEASRRDELCLRIWNLNRPHIDHAAFLASNPPIVSDRPGRPARG